jgi:MoaA/NifB/PqqE/SkfB family radical SAM enzyme
LLSPANLRSNLLVKLGERTNRTHALPILLFAPTARCNSRCVSCDWWRADGAGDLSLAEIGALAAALPRFGTRLVVLTGGEPLVRPDLLEVADLFRAGGASLHLLTSGLALERHAAGVADRFAAVTISLDGHTSDLYREIRGVDGLDAVVAGVRRLRELAPRISITARSTIHRKNFRFLPDLCAKAAEMGLDQISFLAADVSSTEAFNRSRLRLRSRSAPPEIRLLLEPGEIVEFEAVIEATIRANRQAFIDRRIAPGPDGLRRLPRYYEAQLGREPFPAVDCNAPWSSVFVEANGDLRPCFFHPPVGNVRRRPFEELLAVAMPAFRRSLDVASDGTCARCVCTLKVGLRSKLW